AKKRLAEARVSSLRSQYHPVVRYSPWAVISPRLWMSVMKARSAAGFIVRVMPNSLAALSELLKSVPAFASPSTCAPEDCACSRKEEKSAERNAHRAEILPAVRLHHLGRGGLQLRAEGVVGRQVVPGLVAGIDHGRRSAVGERGGVVDVVDGVGRAILVGEGGAARADHDE